MASKSFIHALLLLLGLFLKIYRWVPLTQQWFCGWLVTFDDKTLKPPKIPYLHDDEVIYESCADGYISSLGYLCG